MSRCKTPDGVQYTAISQVGSYAALHRIVQYEETYRSTSRYKHIRDRSLRPFSSGRLTFQKMDVRGRYEVNVQECVDAHHSRGKERDGKTNGRRKRDRKGGRKGEREREVRSNNRVRSDQH